jgi:predicted MFS family arabinose efflux permease
MRDGAGTTGGARRLGLAGFCATAVAFGPARNGYGLFLPEIREEFGLPTEVLGFIASGLYAGYLGALVAVGLLAVRVGPRLPVIVGLLSAALGTVVVALSPNATVLAAGVVLAGTSAGWSWAPYNDAAERAVPPSSRDRVLSVVSTGTTFGIALTGVAALATIAPGMPWRTGWLAFAACAVAVAALNARLLPHRGRHGGSHNAEEAVAGGWRGLGWFWCAASAPLFAVALSFGVVNGVYWSFAVDLISGAGTAFPTAGPLLYVVLGLSGFAGLLTGDLVSSFGLRAVLAATLVSLGVATGVLGIAPGWLPAVGASAVLFGMGVMLMSALLSVWSSGVFRERPTVGFSAALFMFGVGSVVGPAAAGVLAGRFRLETAFQVTAGITLLTAFVRPKGDLPRISSPAGDMSESSPC